MINNYFVTVGYYADLKNDAFHKEAKVLKIDDVNDLQYAIECEFKKLMAGLPLKVNVTFRIESIQKL